MIDAIEKRTKESSYMLNISLHEDDKEEEKRLIRAMVGYHADGLILNCINKDADFEKMLGQLGIPYVILGYRVFKNSHTVGVDEYEATYKGVNFILEKGIKKSYLWFPLCMMKMVFRILDMRIGKEVLKMLQGRADADTRLCMEMIIWNRPWTICVQRLNPGRHFSAREIPSQVK